MKNIKEIIQNERTIALKSKEKERASFLSTMLSEIKNAEIKNRTNGSETDIQDKTIIKIFNKMLKTRNESILIFSKNGRIDLVEKEQFQIDILSEFVPENLEDGIEEQIEEQVKAIFEASENKTMKFLMPILKNKLGEDVDMSIVRKSLEKLLKS